MEILTAQCSFDNCLMFPDLISTSDGNLKFSCVSHASNIESGDLARAITNQEKEIFMKNCHSLILNLKSLKSKIINSTEQLVLHIIQESQKSMKKVDELIRKVNININFVLTTYKIFDKIEENLSENLKKKIQEPSLNLKTLKNSVSNFYSRDYFSVYKNYSESREYHELIDMRLLTNKTTLAKKLQLLSRTLAFTKNPLNEIPKLDLMALIPLAEKPILESPSHLIISLEKNLIITVKADKFIQFWKLGSKIEKFFENSFFDYKVLEISLLKNSNDLIIRFDRGFGKLDIVKQTLHNFQARTIGTVSLTKLFGYDKYLATATFDGTIKIWTVENLIEIHEYRMHNSYYNGSISCFDISSTLNWVISGGVNGEMCLRKTFDPEIEYRTSGHSGGVTSVNFSPASNYIISGGEDQFIKIWDPINFSTALFQKKISHMRIRDISFSFDSTLALTGSNEKVMMWRILLDERSFKYVKIDRKSSIPKFGEYFEDALCYLKYYKS